jgi:hypothetical protein
MNPGDRPAAPAEDPPAAHPLEYPTPGLSPYDRPVEPVVNAARTVRLVVRVTFLLLSLLAAAFAVWAVAQVWNAYNSIPR